MVEITYAQMLVFISVLWLLIRGICFLKNRRWVWKRELSLLLVYVCIIVVVRFTFCPFGTVNGRIRPLLFDRERILPLWLNLIPFIYLFDYPTVKEALLNLVGNIAMFIPLGVVWPLVFPELSTHGKAIAAGVGISLTIEVLQLPFFDRASDIDDLILNSLGFLIGYGIYLLVRKIQSICRKN